MSDSHRYGENGRDLTIYANLMDAALRSKAASIMSHFGDIPEQATIVDVGSGTGQLAEYIGSELHSAKVYAVDLSHEMLTIAQENLSKINLVNDDATQLSKIPVNSVDIMYHGTVGHEINTFCGSEGTKNAIEAAYRSLKSGGKEIWRDFVKAPSEEIYLEILSDSGLDSVEEATTDGFLDYNLLSTNALFQCFYEQFKGGKSFNYEIVEHDGKKLIKLPARMAQEFILRKDYTANWRQEIKEEYTYWTEDEAKQAFLESGFSKVEVVRDDNEYIRNNRLKGKVALYKKEGELWEEIEFPTHMVVVATKLSDDIAKNTEIGVVDYQPLLDSIKIEEGVIKIDESEFVIGKFLGQGQHKQVYELVGENSDKVIKVIRKDKATFHGAFTSIQQAVERQYILEGMGVNYMRICDYDRKGPPYRYIIQEKAPSDSVSAASLIQNGLMTEENVAQMAKIINKFELSKEWQIDTNPYNWFRINKGDHTEMVYIGGTVYRYNEAWSFDKVGLIQWINPTYVENKKAQSARIATKQEAENFAKNWKNMKGKEIDWWKKYLNINVQPK